MAKQSVTIELNQAQEIALLDRFGRGCSRETLVDRAIAEVCTLTTPWVKPEPKKRQPKVAAAESMYPYCTTCGVRCAVSHDEPTAQKDIAAFLERHPSPGHNVEPLNESEIPSAQAELLPPVPAGKTVVPLADGLAQIGSDDAKVD